MRHGAVIFVLLVLVSSNVVAGCLTIPDDKTVIRFDSKLGDVTFAHRKHADLSITRCETCHHKYQPGDHVMKPCHECHKHKGKSIKKVETGEAPKTKDAFHVRCIGCHEYTVAGGQQAGPIKKKCKLCHVKDE